MFVIDILNKLSSRNKTDLRISVIINTLDRADSLSRTLNSLADQSYSNFEVVVVVGPSSDHTDLVLRPHLRNIKVAACQQKKIGVSRNIGLDLAAGNVVVFLDDDAVPEPSWLEKLDRAFADRNVAAAGGPVFDVPLGRVEWQICTCTRSGNPCTNTPGPADRYLMRGADPFLYLAGCNMAFRRAVLAEIGGFNEALTYGYDDVDVCCRIIDSGHQIVFVEDALVHHHRAPNSLRDSNQTVFDFRPLIKARTIFSLQTNPAAQRTAIIAEIQVMANPWRAEACRRLEEGSYTKADFDCFVQGIDLAISEGIKLGTMPRPFRRIGRPTSEFKRFRPVR